MGAACPQLQKGSQESHREDKERSGGPVNERSRKGRFPVLFVENQGLLWRVKGRNSQSPFPRTRMESLTLRKGPRKFKGKGGCGCSRCWRWCGGLYDSYLFSILNPGPGRCCEAKQTQPRAELTFPQVQAHSLLSFLSIASFVHTISVSSMPDPDQFGDVLKHKDQTQHSRAQKSMPLCLSLFL